MEWLKHLNQAINYIEENLDGDISYHVAAKLACCSTYYFQRMFTYVSGVSLSEYIRRRRMTQAAFELQKSKIKVRDIACKYGYDSPVSFNRAFKNVHGVNPSVARLEGTTLNAYPRINFSINITGGESMGYRIETRDALRIVGIRMPLTENLEENQNAVPGFWDMTLKGDQFPQICKLSNDDPHGVLGITAYINPTEIYYYIGASTNKPIPEGMFECKIPAATWVIFESSGHFKDSVQIIFKRFLTEWLPFSGFEYAMLPDIEVYPIGTSKSNSGHSEVWIAIKNEKESDKNRKEE